MAVLRESPWYQEIEQKGRLEGEQTGVLRGKLEGEQALVFRLLNRRIGNVAPTMQAQIQSLSIS